MKIFLSMILADAVLMTSQELPEQNLAVIGFIIKWMLLLGGAYFLWQILKWLGRQNINPES